jgi:Fe-S-cluster containining protein
LLPLTLEDAFANACRFPLAMAWMPVRQASRSYEMYAKLGAIIQLPGQKVATLIAPVAYIPPSLSCPSLSPENLCSIHESKPLRCRTMPFYPYREERDQSDILVPRKGWLCDTSPLAPPIYRDRKIIDITSFDLERKALLKDAPILSAYAARLLMQNHVVMKMLIDTATRQAAGQFVVSFYSFLRLNKKYDLIAFAKKQTPVLKEFSEKTAAMPALAVFHKYYHAAAEELGWFAREG